MATLASLNIKLGIDSGDLQSGLNKAGAQVAAFGSKMTSLGGDLTKKVSLPLAGIGGVALKMSSDFNAAMANVASLGDEAFGKVEEWKPQVQSLAVEMGKSTDDMAGGLYQVVSAFGVAGDTMEVLEINAKAAAGGLATTTDAINLTSAVTKAYGDTSAEAVKKVADLALQTVSLGQTTFPELAASIGRVTPLTQQLGVSQEELFATMATLTGVTGSAAEVSTQLRGALQALMAPTGDMSALFEELGVSSGQALIEQKGLHGALTLIAQKAQETGTPLQKYIGSIEGQTLALALAGAQSDAYQEKLAAMGEATGATERAFLAQTEGINKAGFATQQAGIKMQVAAQKLGDGLAPALIKAVDAATPLIDKVIALADAFANADPKLQTIIVTIGAIAAAVGPVLVVLGTLASGLGTLVGAASTVIGVISGGAGLVASIAALANPIGIVVAAVAGLALAWSQNWFGIRDKTNEVIGWLTTNVPAKITELKDTAISRITELKDTGIEHFTEFKDTGIERATALKDTALERLTSLKDTGIERFTEFKDTGIERLTSLKDTGIERATALKDTALERLTSLKDTGIERLTSLKDTGIERATALKDTAVGTFGAMKTEAGRIMDDLNTAWSTGWGAMGETLSGAWTGMINSAKGGVNSIIGFINRLIGAWNALEFHIPGFHVTLPSVTIPGVGTVGGGSLGWGGVTVSTPDLSPIPTLALGGIARQPTLAMVGEGGPEAIIPLERLAGVMASVGAQTSAGATINIRIENINGTDREAAEQFAQHIRDALRRNGVMMIR